MENVNKSFVVYYFFLRLCLKKSCFAFRSWFYSCMMRQSLFIRNTPSFPVALRRSRLSFCKCEIVVILFTSWCSLFWFTSSFFHLFVLFRHLSFKVLFHNWRFLEFPHHRLINTLSFRSKFWTFRASLALFWWALVRFIVYRSFISRMFRSMASFLSLKL